MSKTIDVSYMNQEQDSSEKRLFSAKRNEYVVSRKGHIGSKLPERTAVDYIT